MDSEILKQAGILFKFGLECYDKGDLDKAEYYFANSLELCPDRLSILSNLISVLIKLGKLGKAIFLLEEAIQLYPNDESLILNQGLIFEKSNNFQSALTYYDRAIELKHNYAEAYLNRGNVLQEFRFFENALQSYDKAIEFKSDFAEAYLNRGILLYELGNLDSAIVSYEKAIFINKDYAEAYFNRGIAYKELANFKNANDSFDIALQINPEFCQARWCKAFLSIPSIFTGLDDLLNSRKFISNELFQLDKWFINDRLKNGVEAIGSMLPFYLAYQEFNNKQLLIQYGNICNRIMSHWQNLNTIKPNLNPIAFPNKIQIGFIGGQIRNHSVWNAITKGFILNIDRLKFDIHIFHLDTIEDHETNIAKNTSTSYISKKASLYEWVNIILEKNLDAILFPEIGMHPLTQQLANLRLSNIQIAFWGHPETTGLPTIDYYFSSELFENDYAQSAYSEKLIKLPNLGCCYYKLNTNIIMSDLIKFGINLDIPILLCPGAPFKYSPKYDWIFIELSKKIKKCKFIFFEKDKHLTKILKNRLKQHFEFANLDIDDFIIFIPWLNTSEFYGLMQRSSLFLDTIGFSGFNTAMQAVDCALPIVTLDGQFLRGKLASGILKKIDLCELIAKTEQEYINIVLKLVSDIRYRNDISKRIISNRDILYEDKKPVRELENFLNDHIYNLSRN